MQHNIVLVLKHTATQPNAQLHYHFYSYFLSHYLEQTVGP
ncbi:hypothetical protein DSUL_60108 [Desulfovibrionales bacterium]